MFDLVVGTQEMNDESYIGSQSSSITHDGTIWNPQHHRDIQHYVCSDKSIQHLRIADNTLWTHIVDSFRPVNYRCSVSYWYCIYN
jgi:hypothetical protein